MKKPIKILVVEDDVALCDVLANIFELTGYDYKIYEDTVDLIDLVNVYRPHVVLLDYLLPSTNGGELCNQLKVAESTKNVPVIIYSAIAKALLPVKEYNCDVFIEKPFDLNYLLEEIERLVKRQAETQHKTAIHKMVHQIKRLF